METKRGRPPKPEGEKAEELFQMRVTADDKNAWRSAAERAGMSLSAWIRDRLNRAAKR
jgi:predicted HicB family RNase H-like nuclease